MIFQSLTRQPTLFYSDSRNSRFCSRQLRPQIIQSFSSFIQSAPRFRISSQSSRNHRNLWSNTPWALCPPIRFLGGRSHLLKVQYFQGSLVPQFSFHIHTLSLNSHFAFLWDVHIQALQQVEKQVWLNLPRTPYSKLAPCLLSSRFDIILSIQGFSPVDLCDETLITDFLSITV